MSILVAGILACNLLLTVILVIGGLKIWSLKREVQGIIRDFIMPEGENQPSPLAKTVDAVASQFSRAIIAQAKSTFMNEQSNLVRGAKAIEGDISQDTAMGNPVLAGILTQFPSLRKSLRRNPGLTDMALQMLASKFLGGNKDGGSNPVEIESRFKFK